MKNQFLTKNEIHSKAPSIFTLQAAPTVSEKYTHIPTEKIIDDMNLLGWEVSDAKEVKARKDIGFQKHLVIFRNNEIQITGEDGDNVYPQILLTNSHDGKNSFTFTAGLFRLICSNGLVISTQTFENMRIRHMGYSFEELQQTIKQMLEKLPLTIEAMNNLAQVELGQEQALDFAKKALETRFKGESVEVDLEDLLRPTRKEDDSPTLWNIFNTVQEKLINGGFTYSVVEGTKTRKARKIKNFQQDMKINSELFELAMEYVN
jgi:hypothetical protein